MQQRLRLPLFLSLSETVSVVDSTEVFLDVVTEAEERPRDWNRYLPALLFAYREVPQSSTGFSPFELLFGRTPRGPLQLIHDVWTNTQSDSTATCEYQYVCDLK
ncbi:hypothetical protein ACOMHN_059910 [Nucella lapillus]